LGDPIFAQPVRPVCRPSASCSGTLIADLVAATDNGLPAPEVAAGIARQVRAPERAGHRDHQRLRDRAILAMLLGCALRRCPGGGALTHGRCLGGIHAGGHGRRTAREYGRAIGVVLAISELAFSRALRVLGAAGRGGWCRRPSASRSGKNRLKADR